MFKWLDSLIDGVTMYRLLLYYLGGLLAAAVGLSLTGSLHYNPLYIIISTLILLAVCWVTNEVFAAIFKAPTNPESSIITALILALIITPNPTGYGITFLIAAAGLAIASKYLLTIRKKHIFNPAAVAVALTALGPHQTASWWVGTTVMLPFVILGGVLVTRKIRHSRMVISFFVATTLATSLYALLGHTSIGTGLHSLIFSSAMFFLGFVMLTEPLTSPATAQKQTWYGILVGALLPPQVRLFNFYSSPELALLVGNVFSYLVSPKTKLFPVLKEKLRIATNTADFVFTPERKFAYQPGQYMELTLPHPQVDARGSRRYFTLASSPTEPDVRFGVKFYDKSSSFKQVLLDIDEATPLAISQLAGDFVMPKDQTRKLAFIAGGIGITPFRSMVKYLIDTNQRRDVALLYSARTAKDIAYKDVFEAARQAIGLRTTYSLSDDTNLVTDQFTLKGLITADVIQTAIPDYLERTFYISGTHQMVVAMQANLASLGVHRSHIKIDFFPGYS